MNPTNCRFVETNRFFSIWVRKDNVVIYQNKRLPICLSVNPVVRYYQSCHGKIISTVVFMRKALELNDNAGWTVRQCADYIAEIVSIDPNTCEGKHRIIELNERLGISPNEALTLTEQARIKKRYDRAKKKAEKIKAKQLKLKKRKQHGL